MYNLCVVLHSGDFRQLGVTLEPECAIDHTSRVWYMSVKRQHAANAILRATAAWQLTLECCQATADSGVCARPSTALMRRYRVESAGIFDARGEQGSMVSELSLTIDFKRGC